MVRVGEEVACNRQRSDDPLPLLCRCSSAVRVMCMGIYELRAHHICGTPFVLWVVRTGGFCLCCAFTIGICLANLQTSNLRGWPPPFQLTNPCLGLRALPLYAQVATSHLGDPGDASGLQKPLHHFYASTGTAAIPGATHPIALGYYELCSLWGGFEPSRTRCTRSSRLLLCVASCLCSLIQSTLSTPVIGWPSFGASS